MEERKRGRVRTFKKRGVDPSFPKIWLIPTFLFWPAIMGGGLLVAYLVGENIPELLWMANPVFLVSYFFEVLLHQGPLQEEFGWRGYALDRLQARFSAVVSSIILGVMWAIWHIPYMFWLSGEVTYKVPWAFLLSNILISIFLTWLYNNTGGSVMVTLINHTMFNLSVPMLPALQTTAGSMFFMFGLIASIIIIARIWGHRQLVRGHEK